MLKIISLAVIVTFFLIGCTSQGNQSYGQNFDRVKAAKTRVSLGLTYLKNGNYKQSKFNLDRALDFAPRSADAHFAMAYYYQSVSELEQADDAYQFAMDLEPNNANIANSYGAFLCHNGDYEKSIQYFLKAVNTNSYISSAETYENLALCSQSQGRSEDAIQYLRSAVNHQPGRANSLFLLASSLIERRQWQEAKTILRRYEKAAEISPQSLFMAIKIERGTGNDTAAKSYLDMLLRIFPNDPLTKSILTDQQVSALIVTNTASYPVASKMVKTVLESGEIAQAGETLTENLTEQVAQVDSVSLEDPYFHIVVKGENLYRISLLYNIKMHRLIEWNGLADASAIFDGKKLSLVAPSVVE